MERMACLGLMMLLVTGCSADDQTGLFDAKGQGGAGGSLVGNEGGATNGEGGQGGAESEAGTGGVEDTGGKSGSPTAGGAGGGEAGQAGAASGAPSAGQAGVGGASGTGGGQAGASAGGQANGGQGGAPAGGQAGSAGANGGQGGTGTGGQANGGSGAGSTSGQGGAPAGGQAGQTGAGTSGKAGAPLEDELTLALCTDGIDNDQNGFADCADNTCRNNFEQCQEKTDAACSDGIDNDKDGFFDCKDTSCKGRTPCLENTPAACNDGVDNDNDGFFDCKDFDCQGNPAIASCYVEPQPCTDDYEPNDSVDQATVMTVTKTSGTVCQTFTICSSDKDYLLVQYDAQAGGYNASLFIKSLSPQVGSTIKAEPTDAAEVFADEQTKQLKQQGTEAKVLNYSSFYCGASGCTASLLLQVTASNAPTPLSYSICVTLE